MIRPDYIGHCINNNNWRDKQSQTNSVNYGRRVNHIHELRRYTYLGSIYFQYRYTMYTYISLQDIST